MLGVLHPISLVLRAINKAFGSAECSVHWRTVLCEFVLCLVLTGRWPLLPLILTNHPWSIGWQDWQPRQPLHIVDLVWQASTLLFSKVLTPNYILTAPDDYEPVFKEASTSVQNQHSVKNHMQIYKYRIFTCRISPWKDKRAKFFLFFWLKHLVQRLPCWR